MRWLFNISGVCRDGVWFSLWGNFSDKYGRRIVRLIGCMLWTLYYGLLSSFAPQYGWLIALRALVGFGIGRSTSGAFWALGAVCEVILALLVMPTLGWRWLLGLSIFPMVLFAILCFQTSRGRIKDLFSPQYRRTTITLWFIWFANAFTYYGIILLTTEMFQDGDACGTTQGAKAERTCRMECKYLTTDDYKDLLWTTLAEFPESMALCFFMFTLCMLPMYSCIGRTALTILIFVARAAISGGYQVVFVYTPEVFPTEIRALALGTSSSFARLGALTTPFVAQVLLRISASVTLSLYWVCAVLAGIAALVLPIESSGRTMQEEGSLPESEDERRPSTDQVQSDSRIHPAP
ncbi:hypothetical protein WMY93_020609 [Mugilogobius chulae]|uniref:Major facilitator superfamily (MFS) profile domain-containing protein n=1 Tax=Mugilogobius chulae TaxID=88201 RepID=A0AAW0NJH4_9GOBI